MSAKPTPPCVRALDADGSEFFLDARGLAWRSDSSRVPELDGPPSGLHTCPGYCLECVTGVDRRNGHGMRATSSSAAPLDRAEVVRVLAALHLAAMRCHEAYSIEPNAHRQRVGQVRNLSRANTVELVADRLGLRAEFDAACREVERG